MQPLLVAAVLVITLALFEALAVLFGVDSRPSASDDRAR